MAYDDVDGGDYVNTEKVYANEDEKMIIVSPLIVKHGFDNTDGNGAAV